MTKRLLLDDARADTDANALAEDYLIALYNLFETGSEPRKSPRMVNVNGRDVLGVWSADIPECPNNFRNLLLVFDANMEIGANGEFTLLRKSIRHQGVEYTGLIRIKVRDLEPSTIKSILIKNLRFGTISHELIHHLDAHRMKRPMKNRYDLEDTKNDLKQYANDPMESNAFYQQLASELTSILEFVRKHGLENLSLYDPIEPDFQKYLKSLFIDRNKLTTRVFAKLSRDRRRRVIARLMALHAEVIKLQNQYAGSGGDAN